MLIENRLSCREKIHCRVSVECLLVPIKCSGDGTNDVRETLCRKYKSLDQAYVFLGQNPFVLSSVCKELVRAHRHPHVLGAAGSSTPPELPHGSRNQGWVRPRRTTGRRPILGFRGCVAVVSVGHLCVCKHQARFLLVKGEALTSLVIALVINHREVL